MPRLPSQPASAVEFRPPSPPSARWFRDIMERRQLPDGPDGTPGDNRARNALAMLDAGQLSQRQVSAAIDEFKGCPLKLRAIDKPAFVATTTPPLPDAERVPAGRYAIENADGELRFYRVWRGTRNPSYVEIHVQHGPEESKVPWNVATYRAILGEIAVAPGEAAIRYGREIGCCSQCGLRLTNHLSRALGIGPVCGGRFFDPGHWSNVKRSAREALRQQGIDPEGSVDA